MFVELGTLNSSPSPEANSKPEVLFIKMSDYEYFTLNDESSDEQQKKQATQANKPKGGVRSDSDCDQVYTSAKDCDYSAQAHRKSTPVTNKRKTTQVKKSCEKSKRNKLNSTDIFGISRERVEHCKNTTSPVLSTYFVNRVANGTERRTATTTGDYYIDLKVYQTSDALETEYSEYHDLWKKAQIRIKFQTDQDSLQWRKLQALVQSVDVLFDEPSKFSSY